MTELLVGIFCDTTNVALFSTSLKIANLLYLPMVGIRASIPAKVASLHKANNINGIKIIAKINKVRITFCYSSIFINFHKT